jgi:regulator of sigma E protease
VKFVLGLFFLSLVVFAHELGHFIAAKIVGIKVLRFSIGIGKRLIGFSFRGTDYCVSLLPIGGYCKMSGEDSFLKALGKGDAEAVHPPGSFYGAHPLKRIFVSFMGPFFNFLFSVVALSVLWTVGFSIKSPGNRIILAGDIDPVAGGSPAQLAGLLSGDRIVEINGKATDFSFQIREIVEASAGKSLSLKVQRGQESLDIDVTPALDPSSGTGRMGIYFWVEPKLGPVAKGGPAARAGLMPGDLITAVDGKAVNSSADIAPALSGRPLSALVSYQRGGQAAEAVIYPEYGQDGSIDLGMDFVYEEWRSPRLGLLGGLSKGLAESVQELAGIVRSLGLLFRSDPRRSMAGTIRIAYIVGDATQAGFAEGVRSGLASLLSTLSIISLSLLVTNLLPIPLLDGGLILIFLVETIRRKPLKPKTIYRLTMAGFFIVAAIFLFSLINDIIFFS